MNDLVSLSELFDYKIFRIPDYQRGYAWGESQLNDFWDDIENLTDNRNHYTGMLSLRELSLDEISSWIEEKWIVKDKGYKAYHVVDGQQRLTTFTILVSCIIKFASKNGIQYLNGDSLETLKSRYIIETKKPENIQKAYKFGYETDNPSFKYLRFIILEEDSGEGVDETFYTINLFKAKEFFDSKIANLFAKRGLPGLENLFRKLVNNLQFNIHLISSDTDVFVAFETMNNRGKKLSNLEILKNRLIYLTTIYADKDLDSDGKVILRNKINEAWKEIYKQLGRNKNHPLDDDEYLKNHWSMYFKYSRNKGDDYVKFLLNQYFSPKAVFGLSRPLLNDFDVDENGEVVNEFVDPLTTDDLLAPSEINNYIDSIKSLSNYWFYSFYPDNCPFMSEDEKEYVRKLNRVGIGYFRTLVVASFCNKKVQTEQRLRLFSLIERTIFIFFRMANWMSTYQSTVAYNFARDLYKGERDIEEVIKSYEESLAANMRSAIDTFIAKITSYFDNKDGFYTWSGLHYFLFEYELEKYKNTNVKKLDSWEDFTKGKKDRISIEHIYPQTPKNLYWRNAFRGYSEEEKRRLTGSLGNMLALSQSVNSSLQNDSFDDKKNGTKDRTRGYHNGSHSEVEVAQYSSWGPQNILERGMLLLNFLERRWGVILTEDEKYKILGLEFLKEERDVGPELATPDILIRNSDFTEKEKDLLLEKIEGKSDFIVELYDTLFYKLKDYLPDLKETVVKPYIGLKTPDTNLIVLVHLHQDNIRLFILNEPLNDSLKIGQFNSDEYNWSHKYKLTLTSCDQIEQIAAAIMDSYNQMK